ncbi:MAG: sigma-54 dependent transcriptional regulator [Methylococcaceae bacterium]
MHSLSIEVKLISFASEQVTNTVHSSLMEIGTAVKLIHWQQWCNSSSSNPAILVLGNDDSNQQEIFQTSSSSSLLAVYSYPVTEPVITFLSSCKECCCWPCDTEELGFRLERLLLGMDDVNDSTLTKLSPEWVKLNLVGSSSIFQMILTMIRKSAGCEAPVLIEGETGTGKEMAARAIHYLSARRDYPFIPVNCGAIPDNLVENELFGHEKGAYTDAKKSQSGLISQADGGTLFLDEIEVLSAKGQVALLRFIEDKNIKPLGAKQCKKVNVRIVAASNSPLSELVTEHRFRQDLLFRLNLLSIRLPPLRERIADIESLADFFMEKYRKQYQQFDKKLSPEFIAWMNHYDWPGNVRELENHIHRHFLLSDETCIIPAYLEVSDNPLNSRRKVFDRRQNFEFDSPFQDAKLDIINQFEKRYLNWLINRTQGNVSQAAGVSGKERRALGKLLKKHDIDPNQYRH